jgi:hypothetical protein
MPKAGRHSTPPPPDFYIGAQARTTGGAAPLGTMQSGSR